MKVHNKTALQPAMSTPHYVRTTRYVEKLERKGPKLETVKQEGAEYAMILARRFYLDPPQELGREAAQIAADALGMTKEALIASTKRQPDTTWRQAAMFATIINGKSTTQTAWAFERNDHTTALHAFRVLQQHIEGCPNTVRKARVWFRSLMEKRGQVG